MNATGAASHDRTPLPDAETVRQQVKDWVRRIEDLYERIAHWLPADQGLSASHTGRVTLHEEPMKAHDIAPVELEILEIAKDGSFLLKFVPNGLWAVGANGKLDVIGRRKSWLLVDASSPLSSKPKWLLYWMVVREQGTPLTREVVHKLLKAAK